MRALKRWPPALLTGAAGLFAMQVASSASNGTSLVRALAEARDGARPYHLRVDCTNDAGARNLEVFADGVVHWDGRLEFTLTPAERNRLAGILLAHGFPSLAAEYGGKKESGVLQAPLQMTCQVDLRLNGVRKRSRQFAGGRQSVKLATLAGALLDEIAPKAEQRGIGAGDLDDGLGQLAAGRLSSHAFALRFLELPAGGQPGSILRIADGRASIRAYAPGMGAADETTMALDQARIGAIIEALRVARFTALPINLYAAEQLDLEVRVLNHRKTVLARPFKRLTEKAAGIPKQRFERLIGALRELRGELVRGQPAGMISGQDVGLDGVE